MQIKKRWIDGLMNETTDMMVKMPFERSMKRANIRARLEVQTEEQQITAQAA